MKKMEFAHATPESQGVDSRLLIAALEAVRDGAHRDIEIHDLIVMRHGKILCEAYFHPYHAECRHAIYSQTKSFMSTAMGLAIGDGLVTLEDIVLDYFPEVDRRTVCENGRKMRIKHLMSMSGGQDGDTMNAFIQDGPAGYFAQPVPYEPGTHFCYNTGSSNICGMIVERVTGKSLYEYLNERIFEKIGMDIRREDWLTVHGACAGGFGLHVKAADVLRLAALYLGGGVWEGEQLIPKQWVELVSKKKMDCENEFPSWAAGYTYQFWNCDFADAYRIDGAGAQQADIVPDKDMVILFNSALHGEVSDYAQVLARHYIYPAAHDEPLPENPEAVARLRALCEELEHPAPQPFQGVPAQAAGEYEAQVSGIKRIVLRDHGASMGLELDSLKLEFGLDGIKRLSETDPALGLPIANVHRAAAQGRWQGNRFFGRATFFPDIKPVWVELKLNRGGMAVIVRNDWLEPVNGGAPFQAGRV